VYKRQITVRPFEGMRFDKQKLEPISRDGIKISPNQIRISYKKIADWQKVLEEVLEILE